MQQLNNDSLVSMQQAGLDIPAYRLTNNPPQIGIVHLGPGAFFRGHQAWYTHKALAQAGGNWGISAVSMRSAGVSEALTSQNGLYALAQLDSTTAFEVVGSIQEVLVATRQFEQVMTRLVAPSTKFVTMTITEKGYCLNAQGQLDFANSEIQQDLAGEGQPITAVGMLVQALAARKEAGVEPLCILSCDNLTDNGKKLRQALIDFAAKSDSSLAEWLDAKLVCPCTMVDSITPATDESLCNLIQTEMSVNDNWPIKRESFIQWVIEDTLPADRPAWEKAGATFTSDVRGFENAKLRLLNCPHSTMAYLGVMLGIETVYDAMQQPEIVAFIERLVDEEVIPSFESPKELDAKAYSNDILDRFRNPAIRHLLAQIAWDGSQKLPMRILPIIEQNLADGRSVQLLSIAVMAWFSFVRKRFSDNEKLVDPLVDSLLAAAKACNGFAQHDVKLLLSLSEIFPAELANNAVFARELEHAYALITPLLSGESMNWQALV